MLFNPMILGILTLTLTYALPLLSQIGRLTLTLLCLALPLPPQPTTYLNPDSECPVFLPCLVSSSSSSSSSFFFPSFYSFFLLLSLSLTSLPPSIHVSFCSSSVSLFCRLSLTSPSSAQLKLIGIPCEGRREDNHQLIVN